MPRTVRPITLTPKAPPKVDAGAVQRLAAALAVIVKIGRQLDTTPSDKQNASTTGKS